MKKISLLFVVLAVFLTGCGSAQKNPVEITVPVSQVETQVVQVVDEKAQPQELFIASIDKSTLTLTLFDANLNKISYSKEIVLDDQLNSLSTYNAVYSNDSVQYDAQKKEVYFSTDGASAMGGDCVNKDGTCVSRIYKMGINDDTAKILFESQTIPQNWIVNSQDSSVLMSFIERDEVNGNTQTLTKISEKDGSVIFTKDFALNKNDSLGSLVLSLDSKAVYQVLLSAVGKSSSGQKLSLVNFDMMTGVRSVKDVYTGSAIWFDTDISPDGSSLAFYTDYFKAPKLHILNLVTAATTDVPFTGRVHNYNLLWSGDSSKLFYSLEKEPSYFDVTENLSHSLKGDIQSLFSSYLWAPSNLLAYEASNNVIKLLDVANGVIVDTGIKGQLETMGMAWN